MTTRDRRAVSRMPSSRSNDQERCCCAISLRCSRLAMRPIMPWKRTSDWSSWARRRVSSAGAAQLLDRDHLVELGGEDLVGQRLAARRQELRPVAARVLGDSSSPPGSLSHLLGGLGWRWPRPRPPARRRVLLGLRWRSAAARVAVALGLGVLVAAGAAAARCRSSSSRSPSSGGSASSSRQAEMGQQLAHLAGERLLVARRRSRSAGSSRGDAARPATRRQPPAASAALG